MMAKKWITTGEAATILQISRVAVFKRIKSGRLKAEKIGGRYLIEPRELGVSRKPLNDKEKEKIQRLVQKVLKEYGTVIKKLGNE